MSRALREARRIALLLLVSTLSLQVFFAARVALMTVVDPRSTTFQRSEAWRLASSGQGLAWRQRWVPGERIATALKQAVITSEDAGFVAHDGVEWDAIEKAWGRNQRAEQRLGRLGASRPSGRAVPPGRAAPEAKIIGGSTISQQLAKNLFLSGERTLARKSQELAITWMLETMLSKRRILEIYLNSVEWGEGVFGAEAAAERYFRVDAAALRPQQAAQLAVMLPAPKRFEKRPGSAYVTGRTATIVARMGSVALP